VPIYEYQCEKCGKRAEYMQSMSEAPKKKCEQPKCGGKLVKLISAAGFVLKGGGWYKDLYSSSKGDSGGSESDKASGSATVPKTDSKAETKSSDSKSDAKSEPKAEAKPKAEKKPAKKQSSKGR
jgi:putative FmdB family regulatory protein